MSDDEQAVVIQAICRWCGVRLRPGIADDDSWTHAYWLKSCRTPEGVVRSPRRLATPTVWSVAEESDG